MLALAGFYLRRFADPDSPIGGQIRGVYVDED